IVVANPGAAMAENGKSEGKWLPSRPQPPRLGNMCDPPNHTSAALPKWSQDRPNVSWTAEGYWLTRTVFQRGLAFVYLIGFLNALNKFKPLVGEHGLLPVPAWPSAVPFRDSPSLFYFAPRDWAFTLAACVGVVLSASALAGFSARAAWSSAVVWALLWM